MLSCVVLLHSSFLARPPSLSKSNKAVILLGFKMWEKTKAVEGIFESRNQQSQLYPQHTCSRSSPLDLAAEANSADFRVPKPLGGFEERVASVPFSGAYFLPSRRCRTFCLCPKGIRW